MRTYIKCLVLFPSGVFSAVFIYPVLHELGHMFFSLAAGFRITDITLFPLPSVGCLVDSSDIVPVIFAGFGGIVFPFFLTSFRAPGRFNFWYIWFVVKSIGLFAAVISIVSLVMFLCGCPLENDDMTVIMQLAPEYAVFYCVILILFAVIAFVQLIRSAPVRRCRVYFGV